jgi:hypothetical protein
MLRQAAPDLEHLAQAVAKSPKHLVASLFVGDAGAANETCPAAAVGHLAN